MGRKIHVLQPQDLRVGSVAPDGRVVLSAQPLEGPDRVILTVRFTDGTSGSYIWPSGRGWTVDGKTSH